MLPVVRPPDTFNVLVLIFVVEILVDTMLPDVKADDFTLLDEILKKLLTASGLVVNVIDPDVVAEITTLSPK